MEIKYTCTKDSFRGSLHPCVMVFDAYENYEALSVFYVSFDKNLIISKEEYFANAIPSDLWDVYVIWDHGKVATCTTADTNQTMRRVAEKVGFIAI